MPAIPSRTVTLSPAPFTAPSIAPGPISTIAPRGTPSPAELAAMAGARRRDATARPDVGDGAPEPTICEVAGECLELHPERAVHWRARRTLFVADVHLGKEHVFGRHGIPIPGGLSERGLERLGRLVARLRATRLVVLGDLMHDAPAPGDGWPDALTGFLDAHPGLRVEVCAGNHDRPTAHVALDARLNWLAEPVVDGPFVLRHHPADDPRGYVLAGHLHPVHRAGSVRRGAPRLPAFWFRDGHAVLPAFGEFTGGVAVKAGRGERLWVAGPERVVAAHGAADGAAIGTART